MASYEELGEVFGLHRASFPRLMKRLKGEGMECPRPRANGEHDVEAWRAFFEQHPEIKRSAAQGTVNAIKEAIEEEKLRDWKRRNDVEEGKYLLRSEVEAWLVERIQRLRDRLASKLRNELPPKLVGLRAEEIAVKMEREIADLCRILQGVGSS